MPQQRRQQHTADEESLEILCIGFGATALSLAVSFNERHPDAKILFLERQPKSTWRPLAHLPGHSSMNTSFMSDLVTFENPRSKFTFIKFLHARNLLVDWTNVGKTQPSRELYLEYLHWCAEYFQSSVRYNTDAASIEPVQSGSNKAEWWRVLARDTQTGHRSVIRAKRVIVAVGQQPKIPAALSTPIVSSSVIHSSACMHVLPDIVKPGAQAMNVAILGDGQQAAEVFDYFQRCRSHLNVTMFMERNELMPGARGTSKSQDQHRQPTNTVPPELRAKAATSDSTASPITDNLIYRLYEHQYTQSVKQPQASQWQLQIHTSQRLSCAARLPNGRLCLAFIDLLTNSTSTHPQPFDLIIAATGYDQSEHKRLLAPLSQQRLLESPQGGFTVDGQYQLNLRRKAVKNGSGLWVLGSLGEQAEENVLPILAERSRRVVDSVMAVKALELLEYEDQDEQTEFHARL